jgi:hypothetical protein
MLRLRSKVTGSAPSPILNPISSHRGEKMRPARSSCLFCVLLALLLQAVVVNAAQKSKEAPPAPIPAQILGAKKVFIANGGGEDPSPFGGGPDRAYNQFYAAIQSWGRYEFVTSPGDADLLFEIQFVLAQTAADVSKGNSVGSGIDPQFRLTIRDPKSNAILWGLREHADWAILQSNRDKNFDEALNRVVGYLQKLAALPATAVGAAK